MMKRTLYVLALLLLIVSASVAQTDWIRTGTNLGVDRIRLASAPFKPVTVDANTNDLKKTFDETLFRDLENSGIFDMVSPSFFPLGVVGVPAEVKMEAWANPPANSAMLAFGN